MNDWASRMAMQLLSRMSTSDVTLDQRDYIAAALREARAMGPEWQPIETAPRDGTLIIIAHRPMDSAHNHLPYELVIAAWRPAWGLPGEPAEWIGIGPRGTDGDRTASKLELHENFRAHFPNTGPTHWQPLPAPPKES